MFARASGLEYIKYTSADPEILVPTDGRQISAHDAQHCIKATLADGHDLMFLQRSYGGLIGGDNPVRPKKEGYTYLQSVFHAPPQQVSIVLHQQTLVDGDDWKTTVDYSTTSTTRPDGSTLDFLTNSGDNVSKIEATMTPVPATASACISPDRRVCVNHDNFPDGFNSDGTNVDNITGGTSYAIKVSQPVQVTLFDCTESLLIHPDHNLASQDGWQWRTAAPTRSPTGVFLYDAQRTNATLNIHGGQMNIMEATNESCNPDCKDINIDTASTQLQRPDRAAECGLPGHRLQRPHTTYSNKLHIEFPTGFEADDRIVQIRVRPHLRDARVTRQGVVSHAHPVRGSSRRSCSTHRRQLR